MISFAFDCKGKEDGFYGDPGNVQNFFECVGGKARNFTCPENLVFKEGTKVCGYPLDTNATTSAHTLAPLTTQTVAQTTIAPTSKATTAAPTPKATTASPTDNPTTNPSSVTSTQTATTDAISAKECAGKPDGFHRDPNDAHKYFQCAGGRGFHMTCPENLVFNEKLRACDFSTTTDTKATTTQTTAKPKTK